jgi:L-ascorbate metabolism protein UlaG (beta-lactamase superfamily)
MEITYYGHACFGIKIGTNNLLFDPFITRNPLAKAIDIKNIKVDHLLISHAHSDHIGDALEIAKGQDPLLITTSEVYNWLSAKGIEKGYGMNHGGKINRDFGSVRLVNATHSSSFSDGSYGGNPAGFVIESEEGNFYFSGDTALTMDMKLIPMFCKLDFAILCIGGYFTMDWKDAIIASDFIECNKIIGMHYDSFPPIKIDSEAAVAGFKEKGKELILLKIGETMTV